MHSASGPVTRIDVTRLEGRSALRARHLAGSAERQLPAQPVDVREAALHRQALLAAVEQAAGTGWWQADAADDPGVWSKGLYRLLGLPSTEPPPSHPELLEMVWPADRPAVIEAVARARRDGGGWDCVARVRTRDGRERVMRLRGEFECAGMVGAGWCVVVDVTDLREAERARLESQELLGRVLAAATEQCVIATDRHGIITTFSAGAQRMLGYTAQEVIGTSHEKLHDPEELAGAVAEYGVGSGTEVLAQITRSGGQPIRRWAFVRKDGGRRRVVLSVAAVFDEEGTPTGYVGVGTDVTRQVRAEQALRASEHRFRLAFDGAPIGMAMLDATSIDGARFFRVNDAFCRLVGYDESELIGAPLEEITHPEDLDSSRQALADLVHGARASLQDEKRYRHADGRDIWVLVSTSLVRDESGDGPLYFVMQVEDITARKEAEQELSHRALHDSLTGLPNRMLLLDHITGALARAERQGTHVAVMFLDLDHFKEVNDSLGHDVGDALLVDIAQRLRRCLRETDTAARLGGDEFVVVCEGLAAPEEAAISAARIERALHSQVGPPGEAISVTVSVGVATSRGHSTPGDLLRDADAAMYRAKERGRARYEIADPTLQASALRRVGLESELREGLARDELELHYQPAYDLRTGKLTALEALLRWRHPTRGLLRPRDFLDVTQDRALIAAIGGWVLDAACRQAALWPAVDGDARPSVWVNVSGKQLGRRGLARQAEAALTSSGLDPRRLWLELAERQLVSMPPATQADLLALPSLGVRLAVDDVGGGSPGLEYLRRVPVTALKIDRSFIGGLGRSRIDTALTRSVVTLGHALDLAVVAEGVETLGQRDQLREMGCDLAQGFALHPPAPAAVIDTLLGR